LVLIVLSLSSLSCNRYEYITPYEDSGKFVGEWRVTETVYNLFGTEYDGTYLFDANVITLNDTLAAFVQSSRKPAPDWVGSGGGIFNVDTMYMMATTETLTIEGQGSVDGTYNETFDTVTIDYRFGGIGVYDVVQVWVRK
ncbi:MAG: hypothetical protein ACPGLV_17060, partial [Bacteroidia bacterium]